MPKFVDTTQMGKIAELIEKDISSIESSIANYDNKAPSLGESSFRPTVESNLNHIKDIYLETVVPYLKQLWKTLNEVTQAYDSSATNVENTSV